MTTPRARSIRLGAATVALAGVSLFTAQAQSLPWTILFAACAGTCAEAAYHANDMARDRRAQARAARLRAQPPDDPPETPPPEPVPEHWDDPWAACCITAWANHGKSHDPRTCTANTPKGPPT